jgi:Ca-activated chloride channel family protein
MKRLRLIVALMAVWFATSLSSAQSGVLIPLNATQPDASVLSLEEMTVSITIDNGDARVFITQIFSNHTARLQEGNYVFALPTGSTVSDFAVWDGPVRIPAVILERRRAEELYTQLRDQAVDPGLLQAGERDGSDPKAESTFSASISPVLPYSTKRLELEYHQRLPVDRLAQYFTLPLAPAQYGQQSVGHFHLQITLHSTLAFTDFTVASRLFPLTFTQHDAHTVMGSFAADNLSLSEDFSAVWKLDAAGANSLAVTTFRDPQGTLPSPTETSPDPHPAQPGFFLAQTLLAPAATTSTSDASPRTVVLLFDNSLSMQWDKLERSYGALQATLLSLKQSDRFSLILFNQDVTLYKLQPVAATPEAIEQALAFVKASRLHGGTDLGQALTAGLAQAVGSSASMYLFTDGNSDRGPTVLTRKIAATYTAAWSHSSHPRTNIFAVGDDANLPLLRLLAKNDGLLENVLSTEPLQPKLSTFLAHSISRPVAGLALDATPSNSIQTIYPLDTQVYDGSLASWIGDYLAPRKNITLTVHADNGLHAVAKVDLPATSLDHPELPRLWAQARVNALLAQIARDGETRAAIDEIIALSRRYKFVTPYTSFLAVPRSLLRPRIIRPGDPVLRVHADPAITSVIALFPFGLTQPLRHLTTEDNHAGADSDRVWETRFLAPADMHDGTYSVRLILRDDRGNTYSEQKTFVIAATPPAVHIRLDRTRVHPGELLPVHAEATATTRLLTARLATGDSTGAMAAVDLHWDSRARASIGELRIPSMLAPGVYTLSVTAEDIAHNVGSQEVKIEILP